MPLLFDLL